MKDRVIPFSNGTAYMIWQDNNCFQCSQYESKSSIRSQAKCRLAFDIDFATMSDGTIPKETAKAVGCNDKGYLNNVCKWKNIKWIYNVKFDKSKMNELKLF